MKTLQVSNSDIVGGAGKAALRLSIALNLNKISTKMLVANKQSDYSFVQGPFSTKQKLYSKIFPEIEKKLIKISGFQGNQSIYSVGVFSNPIIKIIDNCDVDIVNLHWINKGFMSIKVLSKIHKPIVWTLHDMWAFSGIEHYHYDSDSMRYIEGYSSKNRNKDEKGFDISKWVWKMKKKYYSQMGDFYVVTPSRWMKYCAQKSYLFKNKNISVIPNPIDHHTFKPLPKDVVRNILGISKEKKVILFGASSATSDPRKGYDKLLSALKILSERISDKRGIELVIFGSSKPNEVPKLGFEVRYIGIVRDEYTLAILYSSADIFIAPSVEDNLPNTVMESLACGTPVVAFNIGGIPDMVDHLKSGYLAKPFNCEDLANGIYEIIMNRELQMKMSENAREKVKKNFTLDIISRRYEKLYTKVLHKKS